VNVVHGEQAELAFLRRVEDRYIELLTQLGLVQRELALLRGIAAVTALPMRAPSEHERADAETN
jgi:hypothetical protein